MVVYICETCKKEFNKKSNYLNHIENKKKPCERLKLKMHQNAPKKQQNAPEKMIIFLILKSKKNIRILIKVIFVIFARRPLREAQH